MKTPDLGSSFNGSQSMKKDSDFKPTPAKQVSSFLKNRNHSLNKSYDSQPPIDASFQAWLRNPLTRGLLILIGLVCVHQNSVRQIALTQKPDYILHQNEQLDLQEEEEEDLQKRLPTTEAPTAASLPSTAPTTASPTAARAKPDGLCAAVGRDAPLTLWMEHIDGILAASRHPLMDPSFRMKEHIAHMLQLMTPRLHLAQRAVPRNWKHVEIVMSKVDARLRYLQGLQRDAPKSKSKQNPPPPLKILVLGGSVTMGINCQTPIRKYSNRACAWPAQMERLANNLVLQYLGMDIKDNKSKDAALDMISKYKLIEVHNSATGGTNTAMGAAIVDYHILPQPSYDVIINAYSTNDMHVNSVKEAKAAGLSTREMTFDMAQNFTRVVLQTCTIPDGHTPLLLWLDDYLGNEQRGILSTTELSQSIQVLANYYGFGFVSYADAVRDIVYGSTNETVLSPKGWYDFPKDGGPTSPMRREIHPPFTMHLATSYVMSFYLLQMAHRACQFGSEGVAVTADDKEREGAQRGSRFWPKASTWDGAPEDAAVPGLPALRGGIHFNPPNRPPEGLPPRLNESLSLEHVTELWRKAEPLTCSSADSNKPRCPIAWLANIVVDSSPAATKKYFEPYMKQPSGWVWMCDQGCKNNPKYGFMPNATDANTRASMTLDIPIDANQELSVVTLFYMRSYGPKWVESEAKIDLFRDGQQNRAAASATIYGTHEKSTSETYTEEIRLPEPAKKRLRIDIHHMNGSTFKLQGMAVCS